MLASVAALFLVLTLSPVSSGADEPVNPYYIEGYVSDTSGMPMEGVVVSIRDASGAVFENETKANGSFKVAIAPIPGPNAGLEISFTVFGYSILTCPNMLLHRGEDYHTLNLSKATYASRTYTITGSISDMQCAIMIASQGRVVGTVSSGTILIKDAAVTFSPITGGVDRTTYTDDKGHYEIRCPTGAYTMSVSSQGFKQSEPVGVVVGASPRTVDVTLEKSELKKHLGLDMAHILMLIGVIIGIMLAAAAWFLSKRMNMTHHVEIIDDSVEKDDDVRHP